MSPKISIILPVYNCEKYIEQSINSILNQSFSDFELIVINDGSTDNTESIISKFKSDNRVIVINKKNEGLIQTLNLGLGLAQCKYVARMDADDISLPNRLSEQFKRMENDEDLVVLGSNINIVDESGNLKGISQYPTSFAIDEFILKGSPLAHPSVIMRKDIIQSIGGYRKAFIHSEDYDLWLRVFEKGYRIDNIEEPLLIYRETTTGISRAQHNKQRISAFIAKVSYVIRKQGHKDELDIDTSINLDLIKSLSGRYISYHDYLAIGLDWYHQLLNIRELSSLIIEDDIRAYIFYQRFKLAVKRSDMISASQSLIKSINSYPFLLPRLTISKCFYKDDFIKYA